MKTRLLAAIAAITLCAPGFTQSAKQVHPNGGDTLLEWIDGELSETLWENIELSDMTVICELPGGVTCEVSWSYDVTPAPPMEMYVPGVGYLTPMQELTLSNGGAALFDPRRYDALDLELYHDTLGLVGIGQFFAARGDGALFPVWSGLHGSTPNVNISTTSMTADGKMSVRVDKISGHEEALRWRARNTMLYANGGKIVALQGMGWGSRIVPMYPTGESIMLTLQNQVSTVEQCYDFYFYNAEGEVIGSELCVAVGEEVSIPAGTSYFRHYCKAKPKPEPGELTRVSSKTGTSATSSVTGATRLCVEITITFYDCNEGGSEELYSSKHCVCTMDDLKNLEELIAILPAWGACFIETSVTGPCAG